MKRIFFFFTLLSILTLRIIAQNEYNLSGNVATMQVDRNFNLSSSPLSDVRISLYKQLECISNSITANDGSFRISDITSDKYVLVAQKEGYLIAAFQLSLTKDSVFNISMYEATSNEVVIPHVYFYCRKPQIAPSSHSVLDTLALTIKANPWASFCIKNHSDIIDRRWQLSGVNNSDKRARNVLKYLIHKGVDPKQLRYRGMGSNNALITNPKSEEDRNKNRRTTFNLHEIVHPDQTMIEAMIESLNIED